MLYIFHNFVAERYVDNWRCKRKVAEGDIYNTVTTEGNMHNVVTAESITHNMVKEVAMQSDDDGSESFVSSDDMDERIKQHYQQDTSSDDDDERIKRHFKSNLQPRNQEDKQHDINIRNDVEDTDFSLKEESLPSIDGDEENNKDFLTLLNLPGTVAKLAVDIHRNIRDNSSSNRDAPLLCTDMMSFIDPASFNSLPANDVLSGNSVAVTEFNQSITNTFSRSVVNSSNQTVVNTPTIWSVVHPQTSSYPAKSSSSIKSVIVSSSNEIFTALSSLSSSYGDLSNLSMSASVNSSTFHPSTVSSNSISSPVSASQSSTVNSAGDRSNCVNLSQAKISINQAKSQWLYKDPQGDMQG